MIDKEKYNFSEAYAYSVYHLELRRQKAMKILAVFEDYYSKNLENLTVLDVGCSVGIIDSFINGRFRKLIGIDKDSDAISYAKQHYETEKLHFEVQDATKLKFPDNSFDIVICSHIYQYIANTQDLLMEIHRVLVHGGVCYFAAANSLKWFDFHYKFPLFSMFLNCTTDLYHKILKKGDYFSKNRMTLNQLRQLVVKFSIIDYTLKIIAEPVKFYAEDKITHGSLMQKLALQIFQHSYWRCPTYIWLLRKDIPLL